MKQPMEYQEVTTSQRETLRKLVRQWVQRRNRPPLSPRCALYMTPKRVVVAHRGKETQLRNIIKIKAIK